MKIVFISLVLLVIGASAIEEAGIKDFMKKVGHGIVKVVSDPNVQAAAKTIGKTGFGMLKAHMDKKAGAGAQTEEASWNSFVSGLGKAVQIGTQIAQNPAVQQLAKAGLSAATSALSKKMVLTEEAGVGSFLKKAASKVGSVAKKVGHAAVKVVSDPNVQAAAKAAGKAGMGMLQAHMDKHAAAGAQTEEASWNSFVSGLGKAVQIGTQIAQNPAVQQLAKAGLSAATSALAKK